MKNQNFEADLTKSLDKMFINYENLICVGDLNYELLKIEKKCQPLVNVYDNFNLDFLKKELTRYTKNQFPILIDVILTNSKSVFCNMMNFKRLSDSTA